MHELKWRRSSRSHGNGGNCVEIAWRSSSYSSDNGGACVEVAASTPGVLIRDSKLAVSRTCPVLSIDRDTWRGFLASVR